MKRELTCIVCPKGCQLTVELDGKKIVSVEGYTCKRGLAYAEAECTAPTRTVTTTVCVAGGGVLPVKTNAPIPKELQMQGMEEIKKLTVSGKLVPGDVIVENFLGTGVALVASGSLE